MKLIETIKSMFKSDVKWHLERMMMFSVVFIIGWILIMGFKNIELIIIAAVVFILAFFVKNHIS